MSLRSLFRPALASAPARAFSTTSRASYAKMQVIGRLAAQPELVDTSTGNTMVRYTIASNYGPKDREQTSWWKVVSFQPEGNSRNYILSLPKGTMVHLDADAQMSTYEDEGKNRTRLNLVQRHLEVLARPKNAYQPSEAEGEGEAPQAAAA